MHIQQIERRKTHQCHFLLLQDYPYPIHCCCCYHNVCTSSVLSKNKSKEKPNKKNNTISRKQLRKRLREQEMGDSGKLLLLWAFKVLAPLFTIINTTPYMICMYVPSKTTTLYSTIYIIYVYID